ncbi:MAG: DUF2270 domain-containing protein [Anaerolineales bacterium]|nr:DUF2270 domain-containing protein [Anaerolineales bacterium]
MTQNAAQDTESPQSEQASSQQPAPGSEPVWTFRGYRLRPSEFSTAMVHFFRAEISRANIWRQRLDATTNWAVITTGAAITIAFTQSSHHGVVILNSLLITLFLFIEARRYRYYELWSYRVRLMETDFFASMLVPPFHPAPDWAESLAENLLHPDFPITMWEAFGRRFRRNYFWIYLILSLTWVAKTALWPQAVNSWAEFFEHATIGNIPGWVTLLIGVVFNSTLIIIGLLTLTLHQATGEVLPRFVTEQTFTGASDDEQKQPAFHTPWFRSGRRRQQLLATIITDQPEKISQRILKDMSRGVTGWHGKGMYTKKERMILICALTVTEVNYLKSLVRQEDANAFIIVSPAQEILGRGFMPLKGD